MYLNIQRLFAAVLLIGMALSLPHESLAQKISKKKKKALAAQEQLLNKRLVKHIGTLAHDSLEGRRTGTPGEKKAVDYIVRQYKENGIAGGGENGYLQPFEIFEGIDYRKGTTLTINGTAMKPGVDFELLPWTGEGTVSSEGVVALNESGEAWWINVEDIVAKNKDNPHFILASNLYETAKEAAAKGAKAVFFYNAQLNEQKQKYLPNDRGNALKIPVYHITSSAVSTLKITNESETKTEGVVKLEPVKRTGTNVVARLDNGAPLTIAIGAHLDHLGYGEDENSRHTGEPGIHNGADDNASGTAAVLELARLIKLKNDKRFNYVFLHFSGEELGLYGSKFFAENPTTDLKKVSYMINLDMVGRLNDSSKALTVGGFGTSPLWSQLVQPSTDFTIKTDSSGTGPSDHTSFYRKDIPVLFFFTGLHTDYHKPSDDAVRINYAGIAKIVHYIEGIIEKSPADDRLAFTKTREQNMGGGRFKVSIGIMPDYTFSGTGVKADGVIDGRPAQKAGMKANDVILQLGDHLVTGVETYMQALNRFDKGQSTIVVVKRGNEVLQLPITF